MNIYKVYMYTFPDGKRYVGMTKNSLEERRDMGYQHNKALQKAIRKVGWNGFEHKILCDGLSKEEACEKEKEYIKRYNLTDSTKGYNISFGGNSTYKGLKHTEEYKQKMSNLYKGRYFSEETKRKMKESHLKYYKSVVCLDANKKEIRLYESMTQAAKDVGGYATNICRACNDNKEYKNFFWQFATRREVM